MTAGLRWRKGRQGYSDERPSLLQGVGLVSVDNDDYVMINSTHASRQPVFSPKLTQIDEHQKRTYSLNRTSETLSTDASLASARFSTYFQDDYTKSPHRSKDHALSSDGRIKSRIVSVEDDNLRV